MACACHVYSKVAIEYNVHNSRDSRQILLSDKEQQLIMSCATGMKSVMCDCLVECVKVRATSLQELVYKNGQAGVTKATVSITFDNSNKQQSPLGYESYDEITVTRQVNRFIR